MPDKIDLLVPFKVDTKERARNKITFEEYWSRRPDLFNITFIEDYESRTSAFNEYARKSECKYIALADVDCIIPYEQMETSSDVVYPYNYIINTGGGPWPQEHIFGLMIIYNRNKYLEIGGEDERFVAWGWEDHHRYYKALNNGLSVHRVDGPAIHLWHPAEYRFKGEEVKRNYRMMLEEKNKWIESQ